MLAVHVSIQVSPGDVDAFIAATRANSAASLQESGVWRFDLIRRLDDPTRFVLVEVYDDAAAVDAHKRTRHYEVWRDAVEPMMAAPRTAVRYETLAPGPQGWRAAPSRATSTPD